MGILKSAKAAENKAHAHEAAPAFESEEGVVETTAEVKAVTRDQVAPAAEQAETQVAEQTAAQVDAQPEAQAPEAKSTAVIARTEGGVLKTMFSSNKSFVNPLAELRDAFSKNGIQVDYGTFPRLKVDSGHLATAEGKDAGDWVEIQVISYGPTWTVAPGSDDEAAKKLVRFSDDGKTVKPAGDDDEWGGKTVAEYKEHLKALGFESASVKDYLIVHGIALSAHDVTFAHLNEVVSVQLAPLSKGKFEAYVMNRGIAARMGRVTETSGHPVVKFSTERAKNAQGKAFFNVVPSHGTTAPVDLG